MRNLLMRSSCSLPNQKKSMLQLLTTSLLVEILTRLLQVRMLIYSDSAPETMMTSPVAAVEIVVELEVVIVTTGEDAVIAVIREDVVVEKASQSLTKTTMRLSQLSEAVVPAQAAMKVIVKSRDYSRAFRCEEE